MIPLCKKRSKTDPGNYRPVSILSVVSKNIVRVVYNQIESYMTSQNLFYDLQSGFRSSYSTVASLTYLTSHIRLQMDKGFHTGMLMIDLQKAFDTVDHGILLHKLKSLRFRDLSVSWLGSYLANRYQRYFFGSWSGSLWSTAGIHSRTITCSHLCQ